MTATIPTSRHPSAGDLLRRVDEELDPRTDARLTSHLERCELCRGRMAEVVDQSRQVHRYLAEPWVEERAPEARRERARATVRAAATRRRAAIRVRRGWAAAATVAGLLVLSLAVDPLRAWVMERLSLGGAAPESAEGPPVSRPPTVLKGQGSVISFPVTAGSFDLQVEQAQRSGELVLQVREVEHATAQIVDASGETMLVLPAGLRIENSPTSAASYGVTLPASVARVVVRIGDGEPRVITVPEGAESWSDTFSVGAAGQ